MTLRHIKPRFRGLFNALAMAAVAVSMGGCDMLKNGWFDPTEMGRFEAAPNLVQILRNLDTGFEESDEQFASAGDPRPEDLVADKNDYVIGPNDMIQVSIMNLTAPGVESFKVSRVTESGFLSLLLIGQVRASGLTESQLEQAIAQAYQDRNILANAQVTAVTIEARNRTFTIFGAVNGPGQYQILQSDFRLLDALVIARDVTSVVGIEYAYVIRKLSQDTASGAVGAPTAPATQATPDIFAPRTDAGRLNQPRLMQTAGQTPPGEGRTVIIDGQPVQIQDGQVVQPGAVPVVQPSPADGASTTQPGGFEFNALKEPSDVRVIRVPLDKLRAGEFKYNIVIRPQDFIMVQQPAIGEYYMGPHFARTGVYSLTARDITLRSATIAAGGLDQLAWPERTEITRKVGRFRKVTARVNLGKIFAGQEPDILLKPDDEIMVGTTPFAPFLAAFRSAFRLTYGFGFIYDRNFSDDTGGISF